MTTRRIIAGAFVACAGLGLASCALPGDTVEGTPTPAATAPTGVTEAALVGSWSFDHVNVEFLDEQKKPVSEAATVFPDKEVTMKYLDGKTVQVRMAGLNEFLADGTLHHKHTIWFDGEVFEDHDEMGTWTLADGEVTFDIPNRVHVSAISSYEGDTGVMRLHWDREDPMFNDASCILDLFLKRAAN